MYKAAWQKINRKRAIQIALAILVITLFLGWKHWASPTHIAVINYRDFLFADMQSANDSRFIRFSRLDKESITKRNLRRFDGMFIFGMGLDLSPEQRDALIAASDRGAFILTSAVTNPESDLTNLDEEQLEVVRAYQQNGGRFNMQQMFRYMRRNLDNKILFAPHAEEVRIVPDNAFFHLEEDDHFESYEDYQAFYEKEGLYKEGAPRVAFIPTVVSPKNAEQGYVLDFISLLESKGINVYPISGMAKRLEYLKACKPDLVVYVPHGRLVMNRSEEAVAWLEEENIPLLCPVDVFAPYDEWLTSQSGMVGTLMSQGIVTPELDGGAEPFVISAEFPNEDGLLVFKGIPERMETFANRVARRLYLQNTPNEEKKVAIIYYKGAGLSAMNAAGLEVAPALLNLLRALQDEGYSTGALPETVDEFYERIQKEGPVLGPYAAGAQDEWIRTGNPEWIPAETYLEWCLSNLERELVESMEALYGPAPGAFMSMAKEGIAYLTIPRIEFGNVVILPQLMPAAGGDEVAMIHGAKQAPAHPYVAQYLWIREGFQADALIHFGTHGSFEFTPWKQSSLSQFDWPDALIGDLPHFYYYVINNVSEGMIAKRRSYAVLNTHLTPPFDEGGLYGELTVLHDRMHNYMLVTDDALQKVYMDSILDAVYELDMNIELKLPERDQVEFSDELFHTIHNHVHEVEQAKITLGLYTLGVPYAEDELESTVTQMAVDALAYNRARLDVLDGVISEQDMKNAHWFDQTYRGPALETIEAILHNIVEPEDPALLPSGAMARLIQAEAQENNDGHDIAAPHTEANRENLSGSMPPEHPAGQPRTGRPGPQAMMHEPNADEDKPAHYAEYKRAYDEYIDTLHAIRYYFESLENSPNLELAAILNSLDGGYTPPSSGGDPIINPETIPTGRNMYAINPDRTPTEESWKLGKQLADELIAAKMSDSGEFPRKVAFTLWGGEFIRTQGATLAQAMYLMGVEPVRNRRGVVHDVQLIPAEELQRPRIDVVVQTSGQFRDLAASRIMLFDKAVELASGANDGDVPNYVYEGTVQAETVMRELGLSPLDARAYSLARVFGGVNGNYGTGIMGMVESGDSWDDPDEIAQQYLKNMGAIYTRDNWGHYEPGIFEAALQSADTVVHPRSSNTWGPLSLDHVYEFMGGLNNTVRYITGEEPDGYFSDLRNRFDGRIQGVEKAIWVEARSTVFNPLYIEKLQEGGPSSANVFADTFRNTYGWNVLKPDVIDNAIWNELYEVYIDDKYDMGIEEFFRDVNPYALQEMTAVMLETIRKEMWDADPEQIETLANLHAQLVEDHDAGCTGFVCNNMKLMEFIGEMLSPELNEAYHAKIENVRVGQVRESVEGIRLEPEKATMEMVRQIVSDNIGMLIVLGLIIVCFSTAVIVGARRRTA